MSLAYRTMYRLGITPWQHVEPPPPLVDLVEGERALPPGDVLDVGCGTGGDLIYLARHGWRATGVDIVARALAGARTNARAAGVEVTLVEADITSPAPGGLGGPYSLILDGGCIHGLSPEQRQRAGATLSGVAEAGATLVMFAFSPGRRGPLPRGIAESELPGIFPEWDLTFGRRATEVSLGGPLRNADPHWFQLRKR
jgi:SAM-dependent methyltransferase